MMTTMYDDKTHSDSEILGLDAETIWFGSVFAIQTMLSGFKEWELDKICNGNEDIAGDFARRVSFFHEKTLIPVTQYVKKNHKPPSFAVDVLKCMSSHGRNQIFDLHAKLLCGASKQLVKCYGNDFGRSVTEVEKWFAVLKDVIEAFVPFASDDTITELQQVVEAYELEKENIKISSGSHEHEDEEVYVFFCHKFLFIRIAYMVEFYTNANAKMKNQAVDYAFPALGNDQRRRWGTFSGNLIQRLSQHDVCGLPVLDREMATEGYIEQCIKKGKFKFPMIDCLPYGELAGCTWKNRGQLSLPELQESVLCQMFGNIHAKCLNEMRHGKGEREQLKQLEKIFSVAVHTAEKELHTLRNREKVRKCLKKKKVNHSKSRRNRKCQGPEIFMWDVFIMGSHSYFYQFKDVNGKALREFYKKCNARGQLFCEKRL